MSACDSEHLVRAYQTALAALLAERTPEGHWIGELSPSALSTATAVSALALVQRDRAPSRPHEKLIADGIRWLAAHQNADGGWGDTVKSVSNLSTTMLCRAAFHLADAAEQNGKTLEQSERYMQQHGRTLEEQAEAVRASYGKDRTFAVPILTTCALAGLVEWKEVKSLPFELACFPQEFYAALRLPVVSYALPALIAVGQAVYYHRPPRNPIPRLIRWLARNKSLAVLETIQPSSGGFLEAVPLTSFVALSLASIGQARHAVTRNAVEFLVSAVLPDGSWAIDSNLSTWVTTLAVNALAAAGELPKVERRAGVRSWLVRQQFKQKHPYTGAAPGGWAWTPLPGGVPDADDTPGALLALFHLTETILDSQEPNPSPRTVVRCTIAEHPGGADLAGALPRLPDVSFEDRPPLRDGLAWLLRLQNSDGGWPTFCRGWGHLPFDRSGCDLTAHVLRALAAWRPQSDADQLHADALTAARQAHTLPGFPLLDVNSEITRGLEYLEKHQRADGSWLPLWFGNQHAADDENPTYGTARVLAAYRDLSMLNTEPARRAVAWLLTVQNADGGWGGAAGIMSSIEETALAVEVLLDAGPDAEAAVNKGLIWIVKRVEAGELNNPSPIGFYFAKLWYFEKLYPIIFTVAALGRARRKRIDPAP